MNFPTFGSHFSTGIPNLHQFAAKFSQDNITSNNIASNQEQNNVRYASNGISFSQHHVQQTTLTNKYQSNYINQEANNYGQTPTKNDKRENFDQDLTQEMCAAVLQHEEKNSIQKIKQEINRQDRRLESHPQMTHNNPEDHNMPNISTTWQTLTTAGSTVADYLSHLPASTLPLSLHHFLKYSAENIKKETASQHTVHTHNSSMNLLQNNPLNVSHLNNSMNNAIFTSQMNNLTSNVGNSLGSLATANTSNFQTPTVKKKKKKKVEKEKKPRPKPGEIRLTTALDGSTLYCCPECHMAYPEKELLEQHLLGHTLERRFVCDICGAGLKRKDHLTRHKQSHNPERPYVCTVCLKAFKRKEQLTLHFVIHSGEKRHICPECGKGFYRKDHLRKHTRSHIARRVKAELSQQGGGVSQNSSISHSLSS